MTFNQLRYFVEVAERLSFTAAAEHLYLAQSTLSRQIALLEEEFGVAFFVRDKGGLSLTQAGQIFYEEAKTTLVREQQLRARLENASRGRPELLRLGVLEETCPPEALVQAICELRRAHPGIDIMIRPLHVHDIHMQLESGTIDAAYTLDHNTELVADVESVLVVTEPMYLVASQSYPLVRDGKLQIDSYEEILRRREYMILEPALFGERLVPRLRDQLRSGLSGTYLDQLRYMNSDAQLAMHVLCGMGAATVHQSHRLCAMPGVVRCPVPDGVTQVNLVVSYRRTNENPALPVFLELLSKALQNGG